MKIVIDMPLKEFEHFKQFKGKFICDNGYDLIQAIKNGTPLDDITTEIKSLQEAELQIYGKGGNWNFVGKCLDIINKHIGKEH